MYNFIISPLYFQCPAAGLLLRGVVVITQSETDFIYLRTKEEEMRERQRYKKKSRSQQRKSRVFASIYGKEGLVSLILQRHSSSSCPISFLVLFNLFLV